jgi:AcrR family transcriptional regulator
MEDGMAMGESLTQRKMRRTRQAIAGTARRLFTEHGFDQVTVAQIAAAAEVAEKTVYNHFPTKADLVFDADDSVLEQLLDAVRERAPGRSVLTAVRECLTRAATELGEGAPRAEQLAFRRLVAASPTLRAHQRAMAARYEDALAEVLARETGADPGSAEPFVAAVALIGALRAGHQTAARSGGRTAATNRALDLLEAGLADYATRPPGRNPR